MTTTSIKATDRMVARLLTPRSIAIIGANPDPARPGGRVVAALRSLGYPGAVHPVSDKVREIAGYRCVASLDDLDGVIDLAVVVVRADRVPEALRDCGRRSIRNAVVLSSGFREVGGAGAALEQEIVDVAAEYSINVLGPNCLGFVDIRRKVAASFTTALDYASDVIGDVALVSQSGAMGAAIFGIAQVENVGLSSFVSTGNEAVLGFADIVEELVGDTAPAALIGYVEGMADGRRFVEVMRAARRAGTRTAILKVGRTEAGQRAAQSHTGAMSGSDRVWDAALRRCGAQRAESPSQLLDLAMAYSSGAVPNGPRTAIVTMSGGAGVMMSDRAAELGLETPPLSVATVKRLGGFLPGFSAVANPVDFGGVYTDPKALVRLIETVAEDDGIDVVALFVGLTPSLVNRFESELAAIVQRVGKPVIVCWLGAPAEGLSNLRRARVPTAVDPIRAIDMVHALVASTDLLPRNPSSTLDQAGLTSLLRSIPAPDSGVLAEAASKTLIQAVGIPVTTEVWVSTEADAVAAAADLGERVVVKVDAAGLLHKSDVGGVKVGVPRDDVGGAFRDVTEAARRSGYEPGGAIIAELADQTRIELLVGTRWDPQFGAVVAVGAGGTTSEVAQDVCIDLAPVDADRAREMIESLRCAPLLHEFRGGPAFDVTAAAAAVAAASELASALGPALSELDINPLAVNVEGRGCVALDAAAVVSQEDLQ